MASKFILGFVVALFASACSTTTDTELAGTGGVTTTTSTELATIHIEEMNGSTSNLGNHDEIAASAG